MATAWLILERHPTGALSKDFVRDRRYGTATIMSWRWFDDSPPAATADALRTRCVPCRIAEGLTLPELAEKRWRSEVTECRYCKNVRTGSDKNEAIPVVIEKIGKDLYRQVYDITWYSKSGDQFRAITINDASSQECSVSGVTMYVVSRRIGPDGRP
jgi:hypothetical protein